MFFIFSLICSALPARSRCFLLVDLCMLIELCIEFIRFLFQRYNQNVSPQGTATDLVVQIVLIAESQRLDYSKKKMFLQSISENFPFFQITSNDGHIRYSNSNTT